METKDQISSDNMDNQFNPITFKDWKDQEEEVQVKVDEEEEDEEESEEPYNLTLDQTRLRLSVLTKESTVVIHGICLLICRHGFVQFNFAKFHKSFLEAKKAAKHCSSPKHVENSLAAVNLALVNLKRNVLNQIEQSNNPWNYTTIRNKLFTLAIDICLRYFSEESLPKERINELFRRMGKFKNGVKANNELESYAFVFYKCSRELLPLPIWEVDKTRFFDRDWVEEYGDPGVFIIEDGDDNDQFFEEYIKEHTQEEYFSLMDEREETLGKYTSGISNTMSLFGDDRDILLHFSVLKMMMVTVGPRIYHKYVSLMYNLIHYYRNGKDYQMLKQARKKIDQLF